jgi:hypothetical protein
MPIHDFLTIFFICGGVVGMSVFVLPALYFAIKFLIEAGRDG